MLTFVEALSHFVVGAGIRPPNFRIKVDGFYWPPPHSSLAICRKFILYHILLPRPLYDYSRHAATCKTAKQSQVLGASTPA